MCYLIRLSGDDSFVIVRDNTPYNTRSLDACMCSPMGVDLREGLTNLYFHIFMKRNGTRVII